jgi:hypothetical protein
VTEIQIKLAEINARAAAAQAQRDRQFWLIVGYVWLVAIGAVIGFYSIPRAQAVLHQQYLAQQESRNG